jgi:hypothetical protein
MFHRPKLIAAAGALVAALACAAPASTRIIEVGAAATQAAPLCPADPCRAVSRTTAYQAKVVDSRSAYLVPRSGRIVAWTIRLGSPDERQIAYFEDLFGEASAQLTILRRGNRLFHRVIGQSPVQQLQPYFGQSVQFPLERSIAVRRGNVVALTVPSWAPALSEVVQDGSSWRASRAKDTCRDLGRQTAQADMGDLTQYRCLYRERLTYSATLVTDPRPNRPAG